MNGRWKFVVGPLPDLAAVELPAPQCTLILVFRNHSELHAEGMQDRINSFKARVCACAQGLVQALPAQSCVFGYLCHASCLGHMTERRYEYLRVWVFGSRRKIFRNDRIIIEISRRFEWFVYRFLHSFALLSSRAIFFALAMSFVCEAFTPPASKT
jgi:hypothetical protein